MRKRQRYIELPESWDELTVADWRELLKIRQQIVEHGGCYSELDITTETARMLLKNRGVKLQLNNPNYIQLVGQLAKTLGWLWHADGNTISLVYRDTRNLLPKIREWLGPMDHGADLMFGEFRLAMAVMKNYENNPSQGCYTARRHQNRCSTSSSCAGGPTTGITGSRKSGADSRCSDGRCGASMPGLPGSAST